MGLNAEPHEGLLDLDYGDLSGLSLAQAKQSFPALYEAWLTAPQTVRFPSGESLDDVRSRALGLVEEVALQHAGNQVVLVSHLVVCRVLLCALLDVGVDYFSGAFAWSPPRSVSLISSLTGTTLTVANDVCHLQGLIE